MSSEVVIESVVGENESLPPLPRTLILDYYDSYTNNLLTLFTQLYSDSEVLEKVVVVKSDRYSWDEFQRVVLPHVDCIILSPGPGRSDDPKDIGFALDLLRLHPIPILGVCLGHQAIGVAFGGKIINTPQITHGHVIRVNPTPTRNSLYDSQTFGTSFDAVVYNSLIVDQEDLPDELEITAWSEPADGGKKTIMGLAHRDHPIWGVQYHPESISSTQGSSLLRNFIRAVYRHHNRPSSFTPLPRHILAACAYRIGSCSTPSTNKRKTGREYLSSAHLPTPPLTPSSSNHSLDVDYASSRNDVEPVAHRLGKKGLKLVERKLGAVGRDLSTEYVFERVIRNKGEDKSVGQVWLDGQTPTRATTASLTLPSLALTYSLARRRISLYASNSEATSTRDLDREDCFWDWFNRAQQVILGDLEPLDSKASTSNGSMTARGFRGGWIGWFGYEMKEECLQGYKRKPRVPDEPGVTDEVDACWSWSDWVLERAVDGEWILRGTLSDTQPHAPTPTEESLSGWLDTLGLKIGFSEETFESLFESICNSLKQDSPHRRDVATSFPTFRPVSDGQDYRSRIDSCRESIRQGDSYELTLTTPFEATKPKQVDPYDLYLRLRRQNPAYYSAYMSFPNIATSKGRGICILSSSPERFLKIESSPNSTSVDSTLRTPSPDSEAEGSDVRRRRIEMMPIKGTRARIPKGKCVCTSTTGCHRLDPGSECCEQERVRVDARIGTELQEDVKERAENLMIVDLIRSDLLSSCIPSTVTVPKLIALESYGVHHLVTTVQGILGDGVSSVDAIKRCFPPGSMTGAPKLRSVQLLEGYEDHRRRGVYSGALGYISVDGSTDLSVVIRTIVIEGQHMSLGAGGAITWMSDRDQEWEEVKTKVRSVIGDLDVA